MKTFVVVALFIMAANLGCGSARKRWWDYADSPENAGKCGPNAPRIDGREPICNPASKKYHCCSKYGYCGTGPDFCSCSGCKDFSLTLGFKG